ncbi:unnamed protein product [Brassica rapa subsp. trilocularis]
MSVNSHTVHMRTSTYGPIMHLKFGRLNTVIVTSPEAAREVLKTNDQSLYGRDAPNSIRSINHDKVSVGWLHPSSARWRKLMVTHLFSPQRIEASKALRMKKVQELVRFMDESSEREEAVHISRASFTTTLNIISNILFDRTHDLDQNVEQTQHVILILVLSLFSVDLGSYGSEKSNGFHDSVIRGMGAAGSPDLANFFPFLRFLDLQDASNSDFLDALLDETELDNNDIEHLLLICYVFLSIKKHQMEITSENAMSLLFCFISSCFLVFITARFRRGSRVTVTLPPGPPRLPFIGNIHQVGKNPHRSFADLSKTYGPVMSLNLGSLKSVVITSPEAAREVLRTHDQILSARKSTDSIRSVGHHEVSVIWLPASSARWRMLRKLSINQMFSPQRMEATKALRMKKVQELVSFMHERSEKEEAVDISRASFTTVLNIISNILFSVDLGSYDVTSKSNRFRDTVIATMEAAGKPDAANYFPFMRFLDLQGNRKNIKACTEGLFRVFRGFIDAKLTEKSLDNSKDVSDSDFLDALLLLAEGDESELDNNDIEHLLLVKNKIEMGGKGKKRREKNYLASHGGPARLPPPPDRSKQDALPSKLRVLMNYTSPPPPQDSTKQLVEKKEKKAKAGVDAAKKVKPGSEAKSEAKAVEESKSEGNTASPDQENDGEDIVLNKGDEKKKKKRKRNEIKDLRFEQELAELDGRSKRKERKKKYWEAKKQKKKGKTEDTLRENFPKHEQIRFGDVVQAPPKLAVVPKARKTPMSASKERLRLEAIEAYRSRNGWTSRPGVQIPTTSSRMNLFLVSNSFDYFDSSRTMNSISEQNMVNMSFLRGIIDSFSSIFTEEDNNHRHEVSKHDPTVPTSSSSMNGVDGAVTVTNERVAYKLKGYFDLAKEEISKGVRAEEWGLHDDALLHYRNAQRIMNEATSTPSPSYITSSEKEKVRSYREKISKWQSQVSGRLQALGKRTGVGMSENKRAVPAPSLASVPSSNRRVSLPRTSLPRGGTGVARSPKDATTTNPKPVKEAGGGYDDKLVEMINTTIVDRSPSVKWDDVAGLDGAKQALMEMVILPAKRRDLFTGLRRPARGLLLFGPPGNGKTMLAKAVASESQATFFNVSASSLTSKWVGEAEKLVKTLFQVAISRQPSVIFMDEIDSIMSTRSISENEASRRLKSEFLIQFDGVTSNPDDLVIVIGATNKPQELDDAVLRRLVKRIYVPLPDSKVRKLLFKTKLKCQPHSLSGGDIDKIVRETEGKFLNVTGYSGSDLQALCEEAAMMPIRELGADILTIQANKVRPLSYDDFRKSMAVIRPSLSKSKWEELERWNSEFGSN